MEDINIILSTDSNYIMQTCIVMYSILRSKNDYKYNFYFLINKDIHDELEKSINKMQISLQNVKLYYIFMDSYFKGVSTHIPHISKPTYFRLLIPELIKTDRCMYLDSDIIVLGDISEAYFTKMDNCEIAGVIAPAFRANIDKGREYGKIIGLESTNQYINAGVLVMNLDEMRKNNFSEKAIHLVKNYYPTQDQDIINIVSYNRIKLIPFKYNVQVYFLKEGYLELQQAIGDAEIKDVRENPVIIHYSKARKPWEYFDIAYGSEWMSLCRECNLYVDYMNEKKDFIQYYSHIQDGKLWKYEYASNEWLNCLKEYRKIYIYGAGRDGKKVADFLLGCEIEIEAFLVSDIRTCKEWKDIPIRIFDGEIDSNDLIILATSLYGYQIRKQLFGQGIYNIYEVT